MNNLEGICGKNILKKITYIGTGLFLSAQVSNACNLTGKNIFDCLNNPEREGCSRTYGKETSEISKDGEKIIIHMPKGSYTISGFNKGLGTMGGAQFIKEIPGANKITISFTLNIPIDFDANKGGKFGIGIGSGNCPTGGKDSSMGSSVRFMWRKYNNGEIYLYNPGKKSKFGDSIGKGKFHLTPGKKQNYKLITIINTPGKNDGILQLFVNGKKVINKKNILFRSKKQKDTKFNKIISSTFYGGGQADWASKKDTFFEYSNICISID